MASLDEAAPTTSPSVVTSGSSTSPAGGTRVGEKVDGWVQIDPVVEDAMDAGGPVSPSIAELQQYVQVCMNSHWTEHNNELIKKQGCGRGEGQALSHILGTKKSKQKPFLVLCSPSPHP